MEQFVTAANKEALLINILSPEYADAEVSMWEQAAHNNQE